MEQIIGYGMIVYLLTAIIFYSLGVQAGRKDGYLRGRAAGMRVARDRQVQR